MSGEEFGPMSRAEIEEIEGRLNRAHCQRTWNGRLFGWRLWAGCERIEPK